MLAYCSVRSARPTAIRSLVRSNWRVSKPQTVITVAAEDANVWQPFGLTKNNSHPPARQQNAYSRTIVDSMDGKRKASGSHVSKRRKIDRPLPFSPEGSNDEVIAFEVAELLSKVSLAKETPNGHAEHEVDVSLSETKKSNGPDVNGAAKAASPYKLQEEVELDIVSLSSTGDGLAYSSSKDHIIVVPFSVPGDRVLAKIYRWSGRHSFADFVKVVSPSPQRDGVTPECKYFSKCSGCQFQMLPYDTQLEHKRGIVERAFQNFSGMSPDQIPEVEPTMGSPLQYRYRTKLTPHFTRPFSRKPRPWDHIPNIGYNIKGRREVMDIESCPIGTDIVQEGLKLERERVKETIQSFKNGATILLRESTQRTYHTSSNHVDESNETVAADKSVSPPPSIPSNPLDLDLQSSKLSRTPNTTITNTYPTHTDVKTYTSNSTAMATEYVTVTIDPTTQPPTTRTYEFTNTAGSFFQNNNAILGPFTSYIYSQCLPRPKANDTSTTSTSSSNDHNQNPIKYLLDAYSGSGLFTLTLSTLFTSSLGIDIDARSIAAARANATANNLSQTTGFMDADAAALFADVPYPPDQTVVVIDPPRKGCDRAFLKQLRRYGPRRVVYVSCNVHSQARDVGVLVNGFRIRNEDGELVVDEEWEGEGPAVVADGQEANVESVGDATVSDAATGDEEKKKDNKKLWRYEIETLRGFDFFPQTGHVEGVCILNRVG